jgi:hypothetical protein
MILTKRDLLKAKNGAILQFNGEDSGTGNIVFNNNLALSSSSPVTMSMKQTFNIDGADAYFSNNLNTSGTLSVAEAATLEKTLTVTQGSTLEGTLDVTGESIFATNTTVSGTLKAESDLDFSSAGGNLKAGSVNALTVNASGEVTKIGQDTPGNGQFLKWDGNKVVWDSASVLALSLDAITPATGSETRVQTSGDLHLDSTGGEIFLSSSDDFNFISADAAAAINLRNDSVNSGISLSVTNQGNNKNYPNIVLNKLSIVDNTNGRYFDDNTGGYPVSIITSITDSQVNPLHIGTRNGAIGDAWGQNVTGSLIFSSADRRFIFCDSGKSIAYSPYGSIPFFNIEKKRASLMDHNSNFDVEFNVTKGAVSQWYTDWNNSSSFTHSTFLKFNQDGKITKLGHDTPTNGQVLSWDDSNGYVVWSDASTGPVSETYSSKTSNFTALVDYHYSINTTSNAVTITLPEITNNNVGKKIILKFKSGTNSLTTNPHSGETIEENNNFIFAPNQSPGQSITLVSDGVSNWEII